MTDIVDRLRFDATRCELQFSKGVAANIEEGAAEIERLRAILDAARLYEKWAQKGDYPHDEDGCIAHEALRTAVREYEQKAPK